MHNATFIKKIYNMLILRLCSRINQPYSFQMHQIITYIKTYVTAAVFSVLVLCVNLFVFILSKKFNLFTHVTLAESFPLHFFIGKVDRTQQILWTRYDEISFLLRVWMCRLSGILGYELATVKWTWLRKNTRYIMVSNVSLFSCHEVHVDRINTYWSRS